MSPRSHTRDAATKGVPKAPSQRALRVGELVRHRLADLLSRGDIHDDVLASHVISISEVRMSPDLKLATAYIIPLGGKDTEAVIAAFNKNKKYIRGDVARHLNLKSAPEIRFMADDSFAEAERIERLLHSPEVRRDIEKKPADNDEAGD
jgi:ribosome-binding factor A